MDAVYLYDEDFFWLPRTKNRLKNMIGRQPGGPAGVRMSLATGLGELGQAVNLNSRQIPSVASIGILSGVQSLAWAIEQKRRGLAKKITAGPNIAVFPDEGGAILRRPEIDTLVVPSQWVAELYAKIAPELKNKIQVWAAGVSVPEPVTLGKQYDFLVFDKTSGTELAKKISGYLASNNFRFVILKYGNFKQTDYFDYLNMSKAEIYLSGSESQGLAMFEAWARGVPTLVWEPERFVYKNYEWSGNIASPYLTADCGMKFQAIDEFASVLPKFLSANFKPRDYVLQNFTHRICAEKYLQILNG